MTIPADRSEDAWRGGPTTDEDIRDLIRLIGRFLPHLRMRAEGVPDNLRELLQVTNLAPRHCQVLMTLGVNGPSYVGELAKNMALTPATASQLVNELDRTGLVERREDDRDRRRMIVSLTPAHEPVVEEFVRRRLAPLQRTLERLGPAQRAHFLHGWRVMVAEFEGADAPEHPAPGDTSHDHDPRPG